MSTKISPATLNLTVCNGLAIYQGSDWNLSVSVAERNNLVDTAVDLTGYTGVFTIRENANSASALLEADVIISEPESGAFELYISDQLTANIPTSGKTHKDVSTYQYDVYLIDSEDNSYRALQGFVEVSPSITKEDEE